MFRVSVSTTVMFLVLLAGLTSEFGHALEKRKEKEKGKVTEKTQEKGSQPDRWQTLQIMHHFAQEFSKLREYLASDEKFSSEKARPKIEKSLASLAATVQSERPSMVEDNPSLRMTYSMLSYHLKTTEHVFNQGGYTLARQNLIATTNFCISCHTQTPIPKSRHSGFFLGDEENVVHFENAEFLFATRRFTAAMKQFDDLARKYPNKQISPTQLTDLYTYKVAFFARVARDPKAAIANLVTDLKNSKLPADIQSNLKKWIADFKAWVSEDPKLDDSSSDKLMAYVRKNLPPGGSRAIAPADPDVVKYLRISGLLLEQLTKDPDGPNSQEILYYLALFEKKLKKIYSYSLYHSYLRECVLKYPKKKFTKECYDLYQSEITERYAGEMRAPDIVRSTLERMKQNL